MLAYFNLEIKLRNGLMQHMRPNVLTRSTGIKHRDLQHRSVYGKSLSVPENTQGHSAESRSWVL